MLDPQAVLEPKGSLLDFTDRADKRLGWDGVGGGVGGYRLLYFAGIPPCVLQPWER